MAKDVQQNIDASIDETSTDDQVAAMREMQQQKSGIFKLDPANKIPVSKFEGGMWKGRKTGSTKRISWLINAWNEAEAYYSNAQMDHRRETGGTYKGNDVTSKNRNRKFSSTNNQVYATINAEIPSIYAKNPEVEITLNDHAMQDAGVGNELTRFANNLISRKDCPGINLKPKARKSAMRVSVTNEAWMMVGYTLRPDSADAARDDIARIQKELMAAQNEGDITRLEGELLALEEQCDLLDPAGPFCRTLRNDQVLVDDSSVEDDHSDANWMMVYVNFPTNYLNARYRQKNDKDQYVSAYKATHVVDARDNNGGGVTEVQREIDSFHIFSEGKDNPESYGYQDRNAYERGKYTKCWYCLDKVKRRFYLYADNDWTWPIWVFDDPYHLPNFFPLFKLAYHTDPKLNRTKGEVSHYLDQQDDLNVIADELNRARTALRDRVIFDSELDQEKVERLMLSTDRMILGVKITEGKKLTDMIMGPPMPTLAYPHLWDIAPIMQSINQISGIGDAMRGEQFKTNTTNKAIDFYSSSSGVRLDEKRDAIEDYVGDIVWAVVFMCLQFMPMEQIIKLAGSDPANSPLSQMANLPPQILREMLACRCVGGSTQKPTSSAKKAEALQVGQILGQFGSIPYAGILAVKNMMKAFDGMTVTTEDWQMMLKTMMMAANQGNNAPPGAEGAPEEEAAEGEQPQGGGAPSEDDMVKEIQARAKAHGGTVTPMQAKNALQRKAQGAPGTH